MLYFTRVEFVTQSPSVLNITLTGVNSSEESANPLGVSGQQNLYSACEKLKMYTTYKSTVKGQDTGLCYAHGLYCTCPCANWQASNRFMVAEDT